MQTTFDDLIFPSFFRNQLLEFQRFVQHIKQYFSYFVRGLQTLSV